ncbi:hypothetical protein N2152v2_009349 [Parachlorella kessleri]
MRSVGKSALIRSLCGVTKAELQLVCLEGHQTDVQTTIAINSLVVAAMPALQDLTIGIPSTLAGDLDRVLPRTEHLTKLAVHFPDGWSSEDCACFYTENALKSGLLHLQYLQDLSLSELPMEVDLGVLGHWLPHGLTSLSLLFEPECQDPAEQSLQHLSELHTLQRLRVSGCLQRRQVLPPTLSRLTWLDLTRNSHVNWDVSLDFSFAGATDLQHLDISGSELVGWPDGLEELRALTHLDMRGCACETLPPDGIMLPPQLEFLALGTSHDTYWELDPTALPSLTHLTAIRHLTCQQCKPQQLVAALPMLCNLTFSDFRGCKLKDSELQLQPLSALVSLGLSHCDLSRAPPGLRACTRLTMLELSDNPLGDASCQLPLEDLTRLQHIGLARCNLQMFPGMPQGGLPHLTFLALQGNAFPAVLAAQHKWLLKLFPALGTERLYISKEYRKAPGMERLRP